MSSASPINHREKYAFILKHQRVIFTFHLPPYFVDLTEPFVPLCSWHYLGGSVAIHIM